MLANRRIGRIVATLAVALVATLAPARPQTAQAGPISDMMARHRMAKMNKLPPMDKPFTIKHIKDPYSPTVTITQRFKQRFNLNRHKAAAPFQDQGLMKTSR